MKELVEFLEEFISEQLIRIIISGARNAGEISKVRIRPVLLKGEIKYQCSETHGTKELHKNYDKRELIDRIEHWMAEDFRQLQLESQKGTGSVLVSKKGKMTVRYKRSRNTEGAGLVLSHNRKKNYIIPEGEPAAFLVRLGVTDENGNVFRRSYGKFRQINRYLEIVEDVYEYLPGDRTVRIIDFGCGKAYLTFALYHYLHDMNKRDVDIIGLDLKKDVISFCSGVAKDLGYDGLRFTVGDIADFKSEGADMVVTLHACDTATDYALINAVSWNSRVILSVPCCQHELEYLTDGLRGLKLESKGYDVAMIEFTSLEHTARNIMIKAVKTGSPDSPKSRKALEEYQRLCEFYHVKPTIDRL